MKKKENSFTKYVKVVALLSVTCVVILSGCIGEKLNNEDDGIPATPKETSLPEVKISYDSNTVQIKENITGTEKNIPEGYEIWVLVYPHPADKYYPISRAYVQNGTWELPQPAQIGVESDAGVEFDIIAVLADKQAQLELTSYIETSIENQDWPGIWRIPEGAVEYDRITVTREPVETSAAPEIEIVSPLNTAHLVETINGTAKNISEGQTVWIVIYPHTALKYYPINKANIQNEKWSLTAQFGLEKDTGTQFDIIAVLADKQAQLELTNYIEECEEEKDWPGVMSLPEGVKEYSRVTVTRLPVETEQREKIVKDPQPSAAQVEVTYPLNTAKTQENIQGTAKNIPDGQELWIVIYPHTALKYYPINKADIQNEKWELPAQFGESKDAGTEFDIIAVLADKQAQEAFKSYLETSADLGWPGISNLPEGAEEYAKVTVTRK